MSRLAKKPVVIPSGVKVEVKDNKLFFEGKLGKLEQSFLPQHVDIKIDNNEIMVNRKGNINSFKAFQGLYWSLFKNCVKGVSEGFYKDLKIQGLGYKWEIKGSDLILTVGYSKPVTFPVPEGVKVMIDKGEDNQFFLRISGCDKQFVGQVAANIRGVRPPEPYKGKGIRYSGEVVKLKEGKTAK